MIALGVLLFLVTPGCRDADAPAFHLDHHPEALASLSLPPSNRPEGRPPPEEVPLGGPFREVWSSEGLARYEADLPVHGVFWGHSDKHAPPGLEVLGPDGTPLPYDAERAARPMETTWRAWANRIWIRPARGHPPPEPGTYRVRYGLGAFQERSVNLSTSGLEPRDFAFRTLSVACETRRGLLLPAPASATWTVPVPRGAVLDLEARILPPAAEEGLASDGAEVVVSLEDDAGSSDLATLAIGTEAWVRRVVRLPRVPSTTARVRIATRPGVDSLLDYVFVADPVIHVPRRHPRRLLLVFVDTLRRDRVGFYGCERPTTPHLDAWAREAVVFEDARSTAPWTLPSVRSALSGVAPDRWEAVQSLPERLSEAGWTTAAFVNNAYLSGETGMEAGWNRYRYRLLEDATTQVDLATRFLAQHQRRDVAVLVQFMDTHLPYGEPPQWRRLWAGDAPAGLEDHFGRTDLYRIRREDREEVREWVLARYDQNIRYVDEQVARLLEAFGEDAVVAVFSDHGEEFWEHGGAEHGHTLFDELLRVPLAIRAPGLAPRHIAAPVSLLDLAPTLLDLLGFPADGLEGRSLVATARGDAVAARALSDRPLPIGDTLYGTDTWGVVTGGRKWFTRGGSQSVFDLIPDPTESRDLSTQADTLALQRALAEAWGREVVAAWRIESRGSNRRAVPHHGTVSLCRPGGFLRSWHPYDALGRLAVPVLEDDCVRVRSEGTVGLPREIYALPASDPLDPTGAVLEVTLADGRTIVATPSTRGPLDPARPERQAFLTAHETGVHWSVDLQVVPLPEATRLPPGASRLESHLEALGY
ncbi:MAG: sulfatase, partial [Deltaproteobacteria bacterium]|nr:sulfatase [Deltaproteobacteria bacterium]